MITFKRLILSMVFALSVFVLAACNGEVLPEPDPEFRTHEGSLQWRASDDDEWEDIMMLDELDGPQGPQGPKGPDGQDGADGQDGTDGQDGADGTDGIDGSDGYTGPDGQDGVDGDTGRSAFEIYLDHYPGYADGESDWYADIRDGNLDVAVTMNLDGGELEEDVDPVYETLKGADFAMLPEPTKEGYTFEGWFLDASLETPLVDYILEDTDVYAAWAEIKSVYAFEVDIDDIIFLEDITETIDVTLLTLDEQFFGYDNVRINVTVDGPGTVTLLAEDTEGTWHDVAAIGYWGPSTGFPIAKDYEATTSFEATFDTEGNYTITLELYDFASESVIATEVITIHVDDELKASEYEFDYDISDIDFLDGETEQVDITFRTLNEYHFGYDAVRFNISVSGPGTLTMIADGHDVADIGYWGPAAGFELPKAYDATTTFDVTFSAPGEYTITIDLYDVDASAVIITTTITVTVDELIEDLMVVYETGFEPVEGFEMFGGTGFIDRDDDWGLQDYSWHMYFGRLTTTGSRIITGDQSAETRWYTGHAEKIPFFMTNFEISQLREVEFTVKGDGNSASHVEVSYSIDGGTTWLDPESFEVKSTEETYIYTMNVNEAALIRIKTVLPDPVPGSNQLVTIDDVIFRAVENAANQTWYSNYQAALDAYFEVFVEGEIGNTLPSTTATDVTLIDDITVADVSLDIAWSSSNTDIIANDGTVTRPEHGEGDAIITLTATVTDNVDLNFTFTYDVIVQEADPDTTLAYYDFGTDTNWGYAAGDLSWTNSDGTEVTSYKDRVQINTSSNSPHDNMGAFLVFAPINDNTHAYIEFDFTNLNDMKTLEFEYSSWSGTSYNNINNELTSAELHLEFYDTTLEDWVTVDHIDLQQDLDSSVYTKATFDVSTYGAGEYRLSYYAEGTDSSQNTRYAITVDELRVFSE